jgi:hypothetical protein
MAAHSQAVREYRVQERRDKTDTAVAQAARRRERAERLKSDTESLIRKGRAGYRFNKRITVRDARQAKQEFCQVEALPPSPQLLCLVTKLTAVGYSIEPVSCSNAKHWLFSFFPEIFQVSITLQRLDFRPRLSPNQPLSGANQRQILSESLGYAVLPLSTLAAGLTTLGLSLSDSLGILFLS